MTTRMYRPRSELPGSVSALPSGRFNVRIIIAGTRYELGTFDTRAAAQAAATAKHRALGLPPHPRARKLTRARVARLRAAARRPGCPTVRQWARATGASEGAIRAALKDRTFKHVAAEPVTWVQSEQPASTARKLSQGQAEDIRDLHEVGWPQRDLGRLYEVSPTTIWQIVNFVTYKNQPLPARVT